METMAILACIGTGAALAWVGGRASGGGMRVGVLRAARRARHLQSIERLPLTPQHSLHLVEAEGRRLLVAVHPAGCSVLEAGDASGGTTGAAHGG